MILFGRSHVARSALLVSIAISSELLISCSQNVGAKESSRTALAPEVGVVKVTRENLQQTLVVSSELVPFQQIDVYAKEAGFVQRLNVDYGSHVSQGQVMAVLEIPELQMQLDEDEADIKDATSQVTVARDQLNQVQAQQNVTHLQFTRLDQVAKTRSGLIAQQELDEWQGKDLAAGAQVAGARSTLESAQSRLTHAQAKLRHDQVLFDYSKITAPFSGVVTKRYANLGTLMQSGISSSTQALPLAQLSEDDKFRLVIPVPESYVAHIKLGDPVDVRIPSLDRSVVGRVSRFSVDVEESTRTMHTEVDVPNLNRVLMPGVYAEATLRLERKERAIAVPPEAVDIEGDQRTVWVVDPSCKIHNRKIAAGVETPNAVEVTSGLIEGDMVAVGDRSRLREGETVRPRQVQLLQYQNTTEAGMDR